MYRNTQNGDIFETEEDARDSLEDQVSFKEILDSISQNFSLESFIEAIDLDFLSEAISYVVEELFNLYAEEEEEWFSSFLFSSIVKLLTIADPSL